MHIGLDLGGSKLAGILLDARGRRLAALREPTPDGGYDAVVAALVRAVRVLAAHEAVGTVEPTVGICAPGVALPGSGVIRNANLAAIEGRRLGADLGHAVGRDVRVANDANCFALSEAVDGAARGVPVVVGIILGTGVGAGIVVDGKLLTGAHGFAGEWTHNPLPWAGSDERPGPRCRCGRHGCVEAWLSGGALLADALGSGAADAREVAARAAAGDAACAAAVERYCDRLARALAGVVNLLDPGAIVLGGGLSHIDALYAQVPRLMRAHVVAGEVEPRLLAPRHGDASGVRGAAWLWRDATLSAGDAR